MNEDELERLIAKAQLMGELRDALRRGETIHANDFGNDPAVHAVLRNMDGVELWLGGRKLFHWSPGGRSDAEMRAIESTLRTLMCEGHLVTTLPPAPPPVLEVTEEADRAFRDGFDSKTSDGGSWIDSPREAMPRAAGYRAAFPHLLRSCADGLTDEECREISGDVELWGDYGIIRTILRRVAARREA